MMMDVDAGIGSDFDEPESDEPPAKKKPAAKPKKAPAKAPAKKAPAKRGKKAAVVGFLPALNVYFTTDHGIFCRVNRMMK